MIYGMTVVYSYESVKIVFQLHCENEGELIPSAARKQKWIDFERLLNIIVVVLE